MALKSSAITRLPDRISGTSLLAIFCESPSTMAVLPTPASPISTGLFLVRRDRIWITRRISLSRPMTGSSLPSRAAWVRSREYFLQRAVARFGLRVGHPLPAADLLDGLINPLAGDPGSFQQRAAGVLRSFRIARKICSVEIYSSFQTVGFFVGQIDNALHSRGNKYLSCPPTKNIGFRAGP
jgi:hypothetical protein